MKNLIITMILMFSVSTFAATEANVLVKGMVCSFCVNGVQKVLNKQEEVKDVSVDMDKKMVFIKFKEGKSLDEKKIDKLITSAGFSVAKITLK